ncbi:hypothetical protein ABT300_09680 [Streptomyces sp. NPDC001027]|uniref:hypothetical protein n=1 Tax=Streptomyces sp. NPDC001027 TaxID=3154771 RepID=UPI0033180024
MRTPRRSRRRRAVRRSPGSPGGRRPGWGSPPRGTRFFRLPSLDERGARRLAVALDDQPPAVLSGRAVATGNRGDAWARNVEEGVEKLTASVTVAEPGEHVLRVFMVDPAIAVDQIVIDTGGLPAARLAPPESYHPVFDPDPDTSSGLDAPSR